MESYALFYKTIIERETKVMDFSLLIKYLTLLEEKMAQVEHKTDEFEKRKKFNPIQMEAEKTLKQEIAKCEEDIQNITGLKDEIIKEPSFLIPISSKIVNKQSLTESKTNVCQRCRFNCHLECKDHFKNFCKCFNWKFNCKYCPNKCPAKAHEIVSYIYPEYEYKTLDNIIEKYHPDEKICSSYEAKITFAIQKRNEEKKGLKKNLEILKEEEEEFLLNMNKQLNREIESFNSFIKAEKDNLEKENLRWYEDIFVNIIFSFLPKEKDYSLVPDPDKKCIIF